MFNLNGAGVVSWLKKALAVKRQEKPVLALLLSVCCLLFTSIHAHAAPPLKTLEVVVEGAGSVLISPDAAGYQRGEVVTMTAIPAEGWAFDHWEGPTIDGLTGNPQDIVMYNNYTVTAVFTPPTGVDNVRKSDAVIQVVDANGLPVAGVDVQVDMTEIDFAFGTALTPDGLDYAPYRNWVKNNFDWAVAANSAKWYANEPIQGVVTYEDADRMYEFCEANGIKMRGHTVFWAVPDYVQQWIQDLTDFDLQLAVDERLDSVVNHFNGRYLHWDVNNEMLHGSFFADRLGADILPYMFNRVKAIDPSVKTFVNDYNILAGGYSTDDYIAQINELLAAGAQIDAIGVQGHFNEGEDTLDEIRQRLDKLAALGLPIWVTEYDYATADENARADFLESFYRLAFGHPAVEGILMWGFWENDHWRGADAALMNADFSLNAAGLRYEALRQEWRTHELGISDGNGAYAFNGYYGNYQVTLTGPGGVSEVHSVSLAKSPSTPTYVLQLGTGSAPDLAAPNPDPMTWAIPPTAVAHDVIAMEATQATDVSGVEYYFYNLTDPSRDSGWQNEAIFVDAGLDPNTSYSYQVIARDKSLAQNTTSPSPAFSATTFEADGNLVVNAGFEYGTAAGWTGLANASASVVSDVVYAGNYAGRASGRADTWDGIAQDLTSHAVNGATYQASAWVRLDNAPTANISMTVRFTDRAGDTYLGIGTVTATDGEWTQISGTFTLDYAGTLENMTLYFEGPDLSIDYLVDDVRVYNLGGGGDPGNGADMFVSNIAMSSSAKGPNVKALATVTLMDVDGFPVSGATVTGSWSGATSEVVTGTTAADGSVVLESSTVRNGGTYVFTVDDVVLSGVVYDASLNIESSDSITAN